MKKVFIILLNVILVISLFSFQAGCSVKGEVDIEHDFTLSHSKITLEVGEEFLLIASCGDCEITFVSTDVDCATVSNSGLVKAISEGTAFVQISSQNSDTTRICEVIVIDPEYTVEFVSENDYVVKVGANKSVCAKTLRDGVEYAGKITFSVVSENAKILSVNGNKAILRFSAAGDFEVFATDIYGNQSKIVISVIAK